jgi:ligand-binding SRPBCC domain-containing protein
MKLSKTLQTVTIIPRPLSEVFEFFSKAENLNELTPPELSFKILTPTPIFMKEGIHIKYRIALAGIPMFWKTLISKWNPPYEFVDEQLSGPYTIWHHRHTFEEVNGQTKMTDTITYQSKGWILAPFLHWLFVDKKVKEIFEYRESKLNELFK